MQDSENNPRPHPRQIGKYLIKSPIGEGRMGVVYAAYDPFVQRPVAIKTAHPIQATNATELHRHEDNFFLEAHAAGGLQHPHIVSVYDAGIDGDLRYIVMEYVQGKPLSYYVNPETRLPVKKVVDIAFKCALALDYAHRKGVVHRDIKPANILLTDDGIPKITDFGIARLDRSADVLRHRAVGSPYYMAPEQVRDFEAGPQSDLYSLGAVMYQLLTSELPFNADNYQDLVQQILNVETPAVRATRPDVPDALAYIVEKMLAKDVRKRYRSGQQVAHDLSSLFDNLRLVHSDIEFIERRDMLSDLDFFRDFSPEQIEEMMVASTWVQFGAGDTIINEGDIDDTFYIIVAGTAEVLKTQRSIAWLYKGDCFGEIGFLTEQQQRTASIVARSSLILMKVNAQQLGEVSAGCELQYYKAFTRTLISRLSQIDRTLMMGKSQ